MDSVIGGVLIGLAVSVMLLFNGRVTGISGIIGGVLNKNVTDKGWRVSFLVGLLLGGITLNVIQPMAFEVLTSVGTGDYIFAGLLVGFGTLLGNGCTSGHGVCGLSRFSIRSIVSTITFITSGIVSVLIFKWMRGEL